jgi:hypothetical protein
MLRLCLLLPNIRCNGLDCRHLWAEPQTWLESCPPGMKTKNRHATELFRWAPFTKLKGKHLWTQSMKFILITLLYT